MPLAMGTGIKTLENYDTKALIEMQSHFPFYCYSCCCETHFILSQTTHSKATKELAMDLVIAKGGIV